MTDPAAAPDGPETAFESFGVTITLKTNDESVWPELQRLAPPHAQPAPAGASEHRFFVRRLDDGLYDVRNDIRQGEAVPETNALSWVASSVERRFALAMVDSWV